MHMMLCKEVAFSIEFLGVLHALWRSSSSSLFCWAQDNWGEDHWQRQEQELGWGYFGDGCKGNGIMGWRKAFGGADL